MKGAPVSALVKVVLAVVAVLAFAAPAASASERAFALDGSELTGWDKYFLRRDNPITPQAGLGPIHMKVSTTSEPAQFWFDQGLAQLFGFAHEDAIYSFRKALTYDDDLAMAYWGISWAFGTNINLEADIRRATAAYDAEQQALRRLHPGSPSPREKAYVQALQGRYDPRHKPLGPLPRGDMDLRFFERMLAASNAFPDDLHLATFTGEAGLDLNPWNQWDKQGNPRPHTLQVIRIIKSVLERDPHHIGAQHYLVHAVEASKHPEDALLAAERMKSDAWGQPHLVHASSHIYARNGDWGAGMISGEDAEHQDQLYRQRNGIDDLYTIAHGSHNIHFEASVMSMGGRHRLAVSNAVQLHKKVEFFLADLPGLEFYQPYEILMRTRFGEWKNVLETPAPPSALLGARGLWHYARGVAYAKTGESALASRELAELIRLRNAILGRSPEYPDFNLNSAASVLKVASRVLAGRIRWYRGDRALAIRLLREAVALEEGLHYDEPPPWYYPTGESLGAMLLLDGRPREALAAFRDVLETYPGDGWALFGVVAALRADGAPPATVAQAAQLYARAWRWADTPLTIDQLV
jgi:tetratricopeptide (TPR) repeat protein